MSLICRGNHLIRNSAQNGKVVNRSIARGIGAVGSVPRGLTRPLSLRFHNRYFVPGTTFTGLGRRHRTGKLPAFTGPEGTTTNDLQRLSTGIATGQRLSAFVCCVPRCRGLNIGARTRTLSGVQRLKFRIGRFGHIIRGRTRVGSCVSRCATGHSSLPCKVSKVIRGIGSLTIRRTLNTAIGMPH